MTQMIDSQRPINTAAAPRFQLGFADTVEAIRATQVLRYQIFADELEKRIAETGQDNDGPVGGRRTPETAIAAE